MKINLQDLGKRRDADADDLGLPLELTVPLVEAPPQRALDNLAKLHKLGILHGEALMSLVAQAPIDPINLAGTLMQLLPDGWAFSAIDFSMVRVIARADKAPTAAMHVDLMGNTIKFLARNRAKQLGVYKEYTVEPGPDTTEAIYALIKETIEAAAREGA